MENFYKILKKNCILYSKVLSSAFKLGEYVCREKTTGR